MMLNFMEIRSINPRMTQNQICKQLVTSDSTIKRYRDDIQMDSPYKRSKYKKKNTKSNTSISQSQSHTTNETPKNNKNIKNNKKNITLKRDNPNEVHMSGRELIEQVFQNGKAGSILESKQEDNTKFITLARKMVDNS